MISPGETYFADLLDAGRRPVLVVSRVSLNRGDYAVVVAFTTARLNLRRQLPNCIFFRPREFGLPADCVAQCGNWKKGSPHLSRFPAFAVFPLLDNQ